MIALEDGPTPGPAHQAPRSSSHSPSFSCAGRSEKLNNTASPRVRCHCQLGTTNTSLGFQRILLN
ncbi:MAG: hypothetical protein JOZ17_08605 [Acetobacteraceae bacterium]|nr:hypothetical protein [Acetobacteraceae bacterium]